MGFWDFFKKIKQKQEEEIEIEIEKISQNELQSWTENKKAEIEKQEETFLKEIQTKISELISELQEKNSTLKKVNVDEKKAEEKIKLIVKENLDNYVYYLEKLLEKLKEINHEDKKIIEKINSVFEDFKKRSSPSYEKATFLIGKEIGSIKETIRKFFRELNRIVKENQEIVDNLKIISSIEEKIKKSNEIKKINSETANIIKNYNEKISNLNNNIKTKEEEIEKIKKSEKFIEEKEKIERLKTKRKELEQDIENLRENIDFKSLANFYHSFEKEMAIVKLYKENFKQAFQRTNGQDLLVLLKEAKMQNTKILNKIGEIEEKKKETGNIEFRDLGISNIENEIKKLNSDIENINIKKLTEEKKLKKLEASLNEIMGLIRSQLIKINVELE